MVQNTQIHISDGEFINGDCISIDGRTSVATLYIGKSEIEFFLPKTKVVDFVAALQAIIERNPQ